MVSADAKPQPIHSALPIVSLWLAHVSGSSGQNWLLLLTVRDRPCLPFRTVGEKLYFLGSHGQ